MDQWDKLNLLARHNALEMQEDGNCAPRLTHNLENIYLSHATLPNGKKMRLFKSLISSRCKNNCYYCPMRKDSNCQRAKFEAEEYAKLIVNLYHAGIIDGAFISSAVEDDPIRTQDVLIKTLEILRLKMNFRGYLHMKFMPGLEIDQVQHIMYLADRVSLNLEAPNAERIQYLSPDKSAFHQLLDPLKWTAQIRQKPTTIKNWRGRWPSVCTQFVVGGSEESDIELLQTTAYLYTDLHLQRAYYSPLRPYLGTPMQDHAAIPLKRKVRLYQASFLLRDYGYALKDFHFDQDANLPLDKDPKMWWAEKHFMDAPLEVNRAELSQLIRIPGIGMKSAQKILQLRKIHAFRSESDFAQAGIRIQNALPFITMDGRKAVTQPSLLPF
jgi:predicted DNA-binding helix-hairpin-helix protein